MDCIKKYGRKNYHSAGRSGQTPANPWNTNSVGAQNFEKLKGSIEKRGFFKPILARELDGAQFAIPGCEHRWRAAMA